MSSPQGTPLPDGSYVEWQGRTYRGSIVMDPPRSVRIFSPTQDDPEFTPTRTGGWSRVLPEEQVTQFQLRTHCRWRGEPFSVARRDPDGTLTLGWLGRDAGRAEELGLTTVDRLSWGTTVPESEVTDLQQVRLD